MLPRVLTVQGHARGARDDCIEAIRQALTQCGWVRDEQDLPGGAHCFVFETAIDNVAWLAGTLETTITLDDESRALVKQVADSDRSPDEPAATIRGTLELTFEAGQESAATPPG